MLGSVRRNYRAVGETLGRQPGGMLLPLWPKYHIFVFFSKHSRSKYMYLSVILPSTLTKAHCLCQRVERLGIDPADKLTHSNRSKVISCLLPVVLTVSIHCARFSTITTWRRYRNFISAGYLFQLNESSCDSDGTSLVTPGLHIAGVKQPWPTADVTTHAADGAPAVYCHSSNYYTT